MPPLRLAHEHRWDLTPAAARAVQEQLRPHLVLTDDLPPLRTIAGTDVGFTADGRLTRAAIVQLSWPDLAPVASATAVCPTAFPYVPGLLSFREVPALLAALAELPTLPDLLLVDGQGTAHPRRCGLACHLGLLTGLPAIGVAKSRLLGTHGDLPPERGAWVPLCDHGETIGAVLRTRAGVRPLYVSPGHRVSLATALALVLAATPRYRLPVTTRLAHRLASGGKPLP
jgi:deoxyribonuclease V